MNNKDCVSLQKSVEWCEGTPVRPGIRKRLFYIPKSKVAQWPTIDYKTGKYTGSFVLADDAKFSYLDIDPMKSTHTSESQGEYPSVTQLNKLSVVCPGVQEDESSLAIVLNTSDCVFIDQGADGKYRVTGSEMYPTRCKVSQDLGQGPTGSAGTTIEVEATDDIPSPIYEGEIVWDGGDTINPDA